MSTHHVTDCASTQVIARVTVVPAAEVRSPRDGRVAPGGEPIANLDFHAVAESWHDFYLTAGAAAATLIGLLFVGLSINLDAFTADEGTGLRLLAEQAFANLIYVLLIALFVLVPSQDPQSLTIELTIIGLFGVGRVSRRWRTFGTRGDRFGRRVYLLRRIGLPAIASVGLILVALWMPAEWLGAFFWLLGVVLVYLMSAADSAWDLLVEVGRERRRTRG
jgi:hypothetical protein